MKRREFLTVVPTAVAGSLLLPDLARSTVRSSASLLHRHPPAPVSMRVHPFVEAHPDAVFIRRTTVPDKLDGDAKRQAGLDLARELFEASDGSGVPFTSTIAVKPNLTCTSGTGNTPAGMGIVTDIDFLDGLFEGIRETGFPGAGMVAREGNWMSDGYCSGEYLITGVRMNAVAQRHGMHLFDFPTGRMIYDLTYDTLADGEVVWREVQDGTVFRRIGYLAPFNAPDTWLLNVAKFKTHGMGMTLCSKNLQGMVVSPLVRFCEGVDATKRHAASVLTEFRTDFEERVDAAYARHLAGRVPRWDRPGRDATGGYGMETWAQRTCDSHSVTTTVLNIIEGMYGRNGDGFNAGPGAGGSAEDFMTNILIFGRNPFLVDIIGTWLAGHEPGNFGLFHVALERKLAPVLDPSAIALYDWNGGLPIQARLTDFDRTPLVCPYLRRDYAGGSEAYWHLVDEPFDYGSVSTAATPSVPVLPTLRAWGDARSGAMRLEFNLPQAGTADIDIFNVAGTRVWHMPTRRRAAGAHTIEWQPGTVPAGMYLARLSTAQGAAHAKLLLLR